MALTGAGNGVSRAIVNPGQTSIFKKSPAVAVTTAPRPAGAVAPAPIYQSPPASSGGGGSTGGGYAAPAVAAAPRISLQDYINNDFSYRQGLDEFGENGRRMQEFDSETKRLRGETERDQAVRREDLTQDIGEESIGAAEDLAGRGLLRSGGLFQEQDRINRSGAQRSSAIDDILTDFLSQRQTGRLTQEQANRAALNDRINQITQQYHAMA
jgi:hypothetical protein